jgi:hypothetical protein
MAVSLDGRRFAAPGQAPGGEVDADTVFEYHEDGEMVWARYAGGAVRLGYLVGVHRDDAIEFRYSQLNASGETSSGFCRSTVEVLADGRVRLHEKWRWESRPGEGTSIVEEVPTTHARQILGA